MGSIIILLTCLTGLDQSVLQIKTIIVSSHTADSKPVKQEVDGTVILPPLEFPVQTFIHYVRKKFYDIRTWPGQVDTAVIPSQFR